MSPARGSHAHHALIAAASSLALSSAAPAWAQSPAPGAPATPRFDELAAGTLHACARTHAGAVFCWGHNAEGALGDGTRVDRAAPTRVSALDDATQLAAGRDFTCALRRDGTVWCWGSNLHGALAADMQTPPSDGFRSLAPRRVTGLSDIVQLAVQSSTACAVRRDGTVWCWGESVMGERANGAGYQAGQQQAGYAPTRVAGLDGVARVRFTHRAGIYAVRNDGTVWAWGVGNAAQFARGPHFAGFSRPLFDPSLRSVPTPVAGARDAVDVFATERYFCVLDRAQSLRCAPRAPATAALPRDARAPAPEPPRAAQTERVAQTGARCQLGADGVLACADNPAPVWSTPTRAADMGRLEPIADVPPVAQFAEGGEFACALDRSGRVWCWGSNEYGQLGDGGAMFHPTPVAPPGVASVVSVSAGTHRTCVVTDVHQLACAGYGGNATMAAAFGTTVDEALRSFHPARGLGDVAEGSAGGDLVCARRTDGTAACAGPIERSTPAHPWVTALGAAPARGPLGDVQQLRMQSVVLMAQRADGTVWQWREANHATPLVLTPLAARNGAREVGSDAVWIDAAGVGYADAAMREHGALVPFTLPDAVAIDSESTSLGCALGRDGVVRCWGENGHGQRGNGGTTPTAGATVVDALEPAAQLGVGERFACALARDGGAVWCWGANELGQLGDGTTMDRPRPVRAVDVRGAVALAVGSHHACALLADHTLRCWGSDAAGQLGLGSVLVRRAPRPIAAAP